MLLNSLFSYLSNDVVISANSQSMSKFRNNINTLEAFALVYITKADEIVASSACSKGRDLEYPKQKKLYL